MNTLDIGSMNAEFDSGGFDIFEEIIQDGQLPARAVAYHRTEFAKAHQNRTHQASGWYIWSPRKLAAEGSGFTNGLPYPPSIKNDRVLDTPPDVVPAGITEVGLQQPPPPFRPAGMPNYTPVAQAPAPQPLVQGHHLAPPPFPPAGVQNYRPVVQANGSQPLVQGHHFSEDRAYGEPSYVTLKPAPDFLRVQIPGSIWNTVNEIKAVQPLPGNRFPRRIDLKASKRTAIHFHVSSGTIKTDSELWAYKWDKRLFTEEWWAFLLGTSVSAKPQ